MNLDGKGDKTYRVLKVFDERVEVLSMYDVYTSQKYNAASITGEFVEGITGQLYAGSDLEACLTSWFSTLKSEVKQAITPLDRVQNIYARYDEPNTANTPTYTYQYQRGFDDTDYDNLELVGSTRLDDCFAFILDIEEIYEYFGKTCITSEELLQMWTNQTEQIDEQPNEWWLSSAYYLPNASDDDLQWTTQWVWSIDGSHGDFKYYMINENYAVRPTFVIDLSKIPFTKTTEVIS